MQKSFLLLSAACQVSDEACTLNVFVPDSLQLGPSAPFFHGNIFRFSKKRKKKKKKGERKKEKE